MGPWKVTSPASRAMARCRVVMSENPQKNLGFRRIISQSMRSRIRMAP